jgi:hypothetical protein
MILSSFSDQKKNTTLAEVLMPQNCHLFPKLVMCVSIFSAMSNSACKKASNTQVKSELAAPKLATLQPENLKPLNDVIQKHIEKARLHGAVTMIGQNGQVVQIKAHGKMDISLFRTNLEVGSCTAIQTTLQDTLPNASPANL